MQALTNIAARLLRENWSIVEDLFRDAAAAVHHFKKCSQPYNYRNSGLKRACMLRAPSKPPEINVTKSLIFSLASGDGDVLVTISRQPVAG